MKTIEEILKNNPDVYLWADGKTIDICDDSEKEFIKVLSDIDCLKCDTNILTNNQTMITLITPDVKGMNIMCKECGQRYFIHKLVKFPV